MKKILYIILDGLSDVPIKAFQKKTPLEAAQTPHLDKLASIAKLGIVYPVGKRIAPESDTAVISLLGYDVHEYYTGRGPLECFAEGVEVHDGDLALRVNFSTVKDDGKTIDDRRAGRDLSDDEAKTLAQEINAKVILSSATFEFKNTVGHRGVLTIRCVRTRLSSWITNTDPAYERVGIFGVVRTHCGKTVLESKPMSGHKDSIQAKEAALLLNEFMQKSHEVLAASSVNQQRIQQGKLPANILLCRDAGSRLPKFPSLQEITGFRFGSFVEMPVERGIALLTGMQGITLPSKMDDRELDYGILAKVACEELKHFDGLYVHIKDPDEAAHDGDCEKKKESIEAIDAFFIGKLIPALDIDNTVVAITADHTTACISRSHTADPVPLLVCGAGIQPDGISRFSERAARSGSLKSRLGRDVMELLLQHARP
ncbi:alkaline phosphatase family protein [Candidatus Omnitrophota bacterium]